MYVFTFIFFSFFSHCDNVRGSKNRIKRLISNIFIKLKRNYSIAYLFQFIIIKNNHKLFLQDYYLKKLLQMMVQYLWQKNLNVKGYCTVICIKIDDRET